MNHDPTVKPRQKVALFIQWFDILFIMVLCFLTLLTTMLMRGKVLVGKGDGAGLDYTFGIGSCVLVILIFAVYLWYMLTHSERELKEMVRHVYGPPPAHPAKPLIQPDPPAPPKEPGA